MPGLQTPIRVLVIFFVSFGFGSYLIYLLESKREAESRVMATHFAASHAKTIETQLSRSLSATYALASILKQNNTISNFDILAQDLIERYGGISNLQLAPNAIVGRIFPLKGNEQAIGLDLNKNSYAIAAIKSKKLTLEGPFNLIQGGVGVVGRYPVFLKNQQSGEEEFWGFTTALIELSKLLKEVDIHGLVENNYNFELSRIDHETGKQVVFSKLNNNLLEKPVSVEIQIPNGKWMLSISPKAGWGSPYHLLIEACLVLIFSGALSYSSYRVFLKQHELNAQRNEYSLIFNSAPAFIYYKDNKNNILRVNKAAANSLNLKPDQIEGKNSKEFFPEHYEKFYLEDLEVFNFGKPKLGIVEPYQSESGQTRWVQTDRVPCRNRNGEVNGILVFSVDITRQKEAENKILEYSNNLEIAAAEEYQENREKFRLLYNQISELLAGTSPANSGENYFQSLVYHLGTTFGFDFCFLGSIDKTGRKMCRTLAMFKDGENIPNKQYSIHDTPCETVYQGAAVFHTENLQESFPNDASLKEFGLNSFLGVPIWGQRERPIAHLVVMSKEPIEYSPHIMSIISLFAARAQAEMLRIKYEDELETSRARLRELNIKMQSIREEEKFHLAREIHDELGQVLTYCKLDLQWIKNGIHNQDEKIDKRLDLMVNHLDDSINSIRRISTELRPVILDVLGIIEALKWQAEKFQKKTGIDYRLHIEPEKFKCQSDLSTDLFRIFQETLTNIARHAQATSVHVRFVKEGKHIRLVVEDNGKGFDTTSEIFSGSLGLLGMKERVLKWEGQINIRSKPGTGTSVEVIIPIKGDYSANPGDNNIDRLSRQS